MKEQEVFAIIKKKRTDCLTMSRVRMEYIEITNPSYPKQVCLELMPMCEVLDKYNKSYFDAYGNLCIINNYGVKIGHIAPVHFSDLGETQHFNKGCGFDNDENGIVKTRFKELELGGSNEG